MDYRLIKKVSDIITENILTPIIYMLEDEYTVEFVCFCDLNIEAEKFIETKMKLTELLGKEIVLLDIREYDEVDRMKVIQEGEIIYTAHPAFEKLFAMSTAEDIRRSSIEKAELLKRYNSSGSVYLQ
ncbi:MAG: hypothetical protein Q4G33_04975 [bacterium]|nr:hypothetical protein [bacterium]